MKTVDSRDQSIVTRPVLVIFELHMMGDAVISIPFVRAATTKYDVVVICRPVAAELFAAILPPDHIITWTPPWAVECGKYRVSAWRTCGWAVVRDQLRKLKPEAAVCAWADTRVHWLMALSGARVRVGYPMSRNNYLAWERPWRRRRLRAGQVLRVLGTAVLAKPLLTHRLTRNTYEQAHLEDWHQLADALRRQWSEELPWLAAKPVQESEQYKPLQKLCNSAHASGKKVWLIHSGARMLSKRWPVERFQQLVDTVFVPQNIPLVLVKAGDSPCPVARNANQMVVETPTLRDLIAVTNLADCVVCNDSLVSHLASALGKKVVALLGSGSHRWFEPFGNADSVVRAAACPHGL